MVEGTSLLRKHTGLNLYRGFESLALRQEHASVVKSVDTTDLKSVDASHASSILATRTKHIVRAYMRKLLLVLALFSTTAFADTWKMIVDSTDGTRLLVDTDTVKMDKYQRNDGTNGMYVFAKMSMIINGNEGIFVAFIDSDECLSKQAGGKLVNVYPDKSTNTYFWSMDGARMYDAEGQWLCGYLIGTLEVYQKNKQKVNPKSTM